MKNNNIITAPKGDFEKEIKKYTQQIYENPYNYEAYAKRGFCYEELGKKTEAGYDYVVAIRLKNIMKL